MIRLIRVEFKRFWLRRMTWMAAIGLLAILAFTAFTIFMSVPSEGQRAEQLANFQEQMKVWEKEGPTWLADCKADEKAERIELDDPNLDWDCEASILPPDQEEWMGWIGDFARTSATDLEAASLPLVLVVFLIAASFFAAELTTGALGNWLTFEPRRTRVFFSKLTGAGLGGFLISVASIVAFIPAVWLAYWIRNSLGDVTTKVWTDLALQGLRIALLGALVAAVGASLGALMRHTAAALGLLAAYAVVVEATLRAAAPALGHLFVSTNIQAILSNGTVYEYSKCTPDPAGGEQCIGVEKIITLGDGSLYLLVGAAVIIAISLLVFRRRDVL